MDVRGYANARVTPQSCNVRYFKDSRKILQTLVLCAQVRQVNDILINIILLRYRRVIQSKRAPMSAPKQIRPFRVRVTLAASRLRVKWYSSCALVFVYVRKTTRSPPPPPIYTSVL